MTTAAVLTTTTGTQTTIQTITTAKTFVTPTQNYLSDLLNKNHSHTNSNHNNNNHIQPETLGEAEEAEVPGLPL